MKTLLALLFSLTVGQSFAQNLHCGNPNESFASEMQRQSLISQIKNSPQFLNRNINAITYIAIKMHLFGEDDDTGYATNDETNQALANLNAQFQALNVEFYFSGTDFNHYPNSHFNQAEQTWEEGEDFHNMFGVNNAINVYVAESVKIGDSNVGGWSYLAPSEQFYNRMFIVTGQFEDYKTTQHEFGHYFSLSHTFNSSDDEEISERELVTRSLVELPPRLSANCNDKGDFVCDTASDPYNLPESDTDDCVYIGTAVDANNDVFSPDLYNTMGYNWCGPQHFSPGQYDKMTDGLLVINNTFNDFTLDAPETVQPAPTNIVAANTNGDYVGSVSLSWTDNSNVETGYIIERSSSASGPFIAIIGVGANTTLVDIPSDSNQTYYFRVKPSNSKITYSAVSNPITVPSLCGNNFSDSSCDMDANPIEADWRIETFTLSRGANAIINNAASGCSQNGIGNYYGTISAQVIPGESLGFNVKSKNNSSNGNAYAIIANIYADWNNDGDFDDANELLHAGTETWYEVTNTIAIPAGLANGNYRLRVVITASSTPPTACGYWFGEVEDYKLTVNSLANPEWELSALTIAPNPAKDVLEIQSEINPDRLVITDMTGKIILDQISDTKKANISMLASGMYIIQAFAGEKKLQAKFVKM